MDAKPTNPPTRTPWCAPEVVARFATSPPNAELMQHAGDVLGGSAGRQLLDIGCGAGCNAVPLARMGWNVLGVDLSEPMLEATARRAREQRLEERLRVVRAPMDRLPVDNRSCDFIVAHGIWNLARSAVEFRAALKEAARVARPGAALFVYTFARSTLARDALPVAGETFVFTQFSGAPQCFLTEAELLEELGAVGFAPEAGRPIKEYARPPNGSKPAIYEGIFRYRGEPAPEQG